MKATVSQDVIDALRAFRKVRIQMPGQDSLADGRKLVNSIQEACNFPLCYVQRLGEEPEVIIWRFTDTREAMKGHEVRQHEC